MIRDFRNTLCDEILNYARVFVCACDKNVENTLHNLVCEQFKEEAMRFSIQRKFTERSSKSCVY